MMVVSMCGTPLRVEGPRFNVRTGGEAVRRERSGATSNVVQRQPPGRVTDRGIRVAASPASEPDGVDPRVNRASAVPGCHEATPPAHPRLAIVTGADSGMGKAIADLLATEGFDVGITFHTDEAAHATPSARWSSAGSAASSRSTTPPVLTQQRPSRRWCDSWAAWACWSTTCRHRAQQPRARPGPRHLARGGGDRPDRAVPQRPDRRTAHGPTGPRRSHHQHHQRARAPAALQGRRLLHRQGRARHADQVTWRWSWRSTASWSTRWPRARSPRR